MKVFKERQKTFHFPLVKICSFQYVFLKDHLQSLSEKIWMLIKHCMSNIFTNLRYVSQYYNHCITAVLHDAITCMTCDTLMLQEKLRRTVQKRKELFSIFSWLCSLPIFSKWGLPTFHQEPKTSIWNQHMKWEMNIYLGEKHWYPSLACL